MSELSQPSLRTRLILAVLLTTLPLMGLIWYGAKWEYERESTVLEQEVQRLTAFITGDVNHLLESTRQILMAVSGVSQATKPEVGRIILADLAQRCPYYLNFGVVSLDRGSGQPEFRAVHTPEAAVDVDLLQRAIDSRQLAIGEFQPTSHAAGKNLLSVAYCMSAESHSNPASVAFAVLDLGWLDYLLSEERVTGQKSLFPAGMILNIVNREGIILTRYPDKERWAGKKLPDATILDEIFRKGEGAAELTGVDGVSRFYAFQSVRAASDQIFVCTGVSKHDALASIRENTRRSLVAVSLVGLLLILAAWFGTELFIVRPAALLVQTSRRLGEGDLTVRTGITGGPREITQLAQAFDRMAESLQREAQEKERMQAEILEYDRQLRSMAMERALVEEHERKQIAAGLHDTAGPLLAACYMKLGRALKLPVPEGVAVTLRESRDLIDQAIGELRTLTFDLSSPTLYTLGLLAAVEELCRDTMRTHAMTVTFQDQGTPDDLGHDQRIVLFQAVRELLLNVVRHAEATTVTVTCGGDAEEVFISVADNGVGFDAAHAGSGFSRTGGFGLFNLRERFTYMKGRFSVASSRGAGTRVVVALPVVPQAREREEPHGD